ncbi:primosomal protein N' [Paludibacter sp.]
MKYVDIILPLPITGNFTYSVPDEWEDRVRIGMRAVVQFGSKKLYTGIITVIHTIYKPIYQIKEIISLLDLEPIIRRPQYQFWEWISEYYMSHIGEVYQAAVPSGLKLSSETEVKIISDFEAMEALTSKEENILDILSDEKPHSILELNKLTNSADVMPTINKLLGKGAIEISESLAEKYKAKTETCIRLTEQFSKEEQIKALFDTLSNAPKQLSILMHYIEKSNILNNKTLKPILRKQLIEDTNISASVLTSMISKGIFETYTIEVGRLDSSNNSTLQANPLNKYQEQAYHSIEKQFIEKQVILLHGVTSSGKTEIYIHLIQKIVAEGRQVLYLVPEIALTTQLTSRLKSIFGNKLGVYHSKFSDAERVEIWNNVLQNKTYDIIIGVRSSIFLPFRHLGLVIVDEEHESSFKQYDPAPRYNARNAAIVLASMHGAKTLLGTATPSIESYYNAQIGKYGFVQINERYQEIQLPEIHIVDMKEAYHKKQYEGHFSDALIEKIKTALSNKEQIILFQNRRGYSPYIECKACAYIPKCTNCDVSLTYHAGINTLTCHYCGYSMRLIEKCPICNTADFHTRGFGTEKIEDEIIKLFPEARVLRMDLDTTRSKNAYQQIINSVEDYKVDILIGTQMVTKGLDFSRVSLVGILNADNLLNFPDFRAHERAFQMLTQVSGRAGRANKRGTVIIQTSSPSHPIINQVVHNSYLMMYNLQISERQQYKYPPFYRMIQLSLKHQDLSVLNNAAKDIATTLKSVFGNRVLGPVSPLISRIQNLHIRQIVLKIETEASIKIAKEHLKAVIKNIQTMQPYKSVRFTIDVDPN